MNPLTVNPVIALQEAHANRVRTVRRSNRDRAVNAARTARRALERIGR